MIKQATLSGEMDLALTTSWKAAGRSTGGAIRMFHGPGEGCGNLDYFAIDRFSERAGVDHYWVTQWENSRSSGVSELNFIVEYLKNKGAKSVVGLTRPQKGVPEVPVTHYGVPPEGRFATREGALQFLIQLKDSRHPGLFLDHQPLRAWLVEQCAGMRVLNTFAYTGSLSVAAGVGGADLITTLDLSKPSIEWAGQNLRLNGIEGSRSNLIFGDYFEWMPRLKKKGEKFDCIILDPPSFSRGKSSGERFSTSRDLPRLHELALDLVSPRGVLISSINSAQISSKKFEADILKALDGRQAKVLRTLDLPETFPTILGDESSRYLKGWILRV